MEIQQKSADQKGILNQPQDAAQQQLSQKLNTIKQLVSNLKQREQYNLIKMLFHNILL